MWFTGLNALRFFHGHLGSRGTLHGKSLVRAGEFGATLQHFWTERLIFGIPSEDLDVPACERPKGHQGGPRLDFEKPAHGNDEKSVFLSNPPSFLTYQLEILLDFEGVFGACFRNVMKGNGKTVSYTHLRANENEADLVCSLLREK